MNMNTKVKGFDKWLGNLKIRLRMIFGFKVICGE